MIVKEMCHLHFLFQGKSTKFGIIPKFLTLSRNIPQHWILMFLNLGLEITLYILGT